MKQRRADRSSPAKSATRGASPPEPPPPHSPSSELTEAGSGSGLSGSCSSDSDASMAVLMPAILESGMVAKMKEHTDQFLQFMSSTLPTSSSSEEGGPGATGSERFGSKIDTTAATLEIAQCRADDFELQQQQSCATASTTLPKNLGLADAKASAPAWTRVCSLHGKMACSACSRSPPPVQDASIHKKA